MMGRSTQRCRAEADSSPALRAWAAVLFSEPPPVALSCSMQKREQHGSIGMPEHPTTQVTAGNLAEPVQHTGRGWAAGVAP